MANYGKYYIAVRLLLLKQYLEANAERMNVGAVIDRPRAIDNRPYNKDGGCAGFSGKHILIFFIKKPP